MEINATRCHQQHKLCQKEIIHAFHNENRENLQIFAKTEMKHTSLNFRRIKFDTDAGFLWSHLKGENGY